MSNWHRTWCREISPTKNLQHQSKFTVDTRKANSCKLKNFSSKMDLNSLIKYHQTQNSECFLPNKLKPQVNQVRWNLTTSRRRWSHLKYSKASKSKLAWTLISQRQLLQVFHRRIKQLRVLLRQLILSSHINKILIRQLTQITQQAMLATYRGRRRSRQDAASMNDRTT